MQVITKEFYVAKGFDTPFESKDACSKFEKFCESIRVFPIKYDTDFTEGKYILSKDAYVFIRVKENNVENLIKYYLNEQYGPEFNCVSGKYSSSNVLRAWKVEKELKEGVYALDLNSGDCKLGGFILDDECITDLQVLSGRKFNLGSVLKEICELED